MPPTWLEGGVANLKRHFAVDDVPRFIFPVVDVQRWLGSPKGQRLHMGEASVRRRIGQLDREPPTERPNRLSFTGTKKERLTLAHVRLTWPDQAGVDAGGRSAWSGLAR